MQEAGFTRSSIANHQKFKQEIWNTNAVIKLIIWKIIHFGCIHNKQSIIHLEECFWLVNAHYNGCNPYLFICLCKYTTIGLFWPVATMYYCITIITSFTIIRCDENDHWESGPVYRTFTAAPSPRALTEMHPWPRLPFAWTRRLANHL